MSTLKLAVTLSTEGMTLIRHRRLEVDAAELPGMDRAQTLVRSNPQDWASQILDHAAIAPEAELPGLIEALDCLLSIDERPSAELVQERRSRL